VDEKLRDPAVTLLVAEEGDELLGFTACGDSRDEDGDADTGEIRTFFVSPASWRRGVGRALMQAALQDLRRRGYERCTVWSFAANRQANSFYEALGFMPDGGERSEAAWAHILEVRYARALS
jgi:GNAT superfamily N-acetyltransferase